ncbi:DUF1653 domain-containing protein [Bacillus subtilis]
MILKRKETILMDTYEDMDGILWARPKKMFFGTVVVDGKEINRFTKIK